MRQLPFNGASLQLVPLRKFLYFNLLSVFFVFIAGISYKFAPEGIFSIQLGEILF